MIIPGLLCFSSCRWGGSEKEKAMLESQRQALGCAQFETSFWDSIDSFLVSEKDIPSLRALKDQIQAYGKQGFISPATQEAWLGLQNVIFQEASEKDHYRTAQQLRMFLAAMEVGDQTSDLRKEIKLQIYSQLKKLKDSVPAKSCQPFSENKNRPDYFNHAGNISSAEKGMRWLFATAYQSCDAVLKPAINEQTPNIQGVLDLGLHPDGVGHLRKIMDRHLFMNSHYYYQGLRHGVSCRAESETPLIYDYGGKPFSLDQEVGDHQRVSVLDIFKNDGTGSEALGVDCAAAIFTATATAGLRLKPELPLRARQVLGVNSRMFKDPVANGLECFHPISLGGDTSIQSGDIAAVNGHVLMIGDTGSDPLGFESIRQEKDCDSLSVEHFDFKIWQSGPQKGGIGLNHIEAKDYLKDTIKMKDGFEAYAKLACKARFDKKEIAPQLALFAIIRHNHSPECLAGRIALQGEECIKDCL